MLTLPPSHSQVLGYFIALVALCVTHLREYSTLWLTPIYNIAWFDDGDSKRSSVPQLPPLDTSPIHLSITPLPQVNDDDVENQLPALAPTTVDQTRDKPLPSSPRSNVWWGHMFPGRAGRDHPFAIRRPGGRAEGHYYPSYHSSTEPRRKTNDDNDDNKDLVRSPTIRVPAATLPSYRAQQPRRSWQRPPRQQAMRDEPTRFGVTQDTSDPLTPGPSFMVDVVTNEDEPISVGDRSQWVRALRAPGPYIPPPPTSWRGGRRN